MQGFGRTHRTWCSSRCCVGQTNRLLRLLFLELAFGLLGSASCYNAPLDAKVDVSKPRSTFIGKLGSHISNSSPPADFSFEQPKKRTLKNAPEEIVQRTGVRNNGIIEIYDPEAERKRIEFEQAFINGKRYRIPERIVQLDFWGKIGRRPQ